MESEHLAITRFGFGTGEKKWDQWKESPPERVKHSRIVISSAWGRIYRVLYRLGEEEREFIAKINSKDGCARNELEALKRTREWFREKGIPWFIYLYHYKVEGGKTSMILEHADADLFHYLSKRQPDATYSRSWWASIIMQVIFAVADLQKYRMNHNDLKCTNIFLKRVEKGGFWVWEHRRKKYLIPNEGFLIRVGDFGLSSWPERPNYVVEENEEYYSEYGLSQAFRPGYDLNLFLYDLCFGRSVTVKPPRDLLIKLRPLISTGNEGRLPLGVENDRTVPSELIQVFASDYEIESWAGKEVDIWGQFRVI